MAKNAEPVSCVAGSTTRVEKPTSRSISGVRAPSTSPGILGLVNIEVGMPRVSSSPVSQSFVRASSMFVVVAFVYSFAATPVSR